MTLKQWQVALLAVYIINHFHFDSKDTSANVQDKSQKIFLMKLFRAHYGHGNDTKTQRQHQ